MASTATTKNPSTLKDYLTEVQDFSTSTGNNNDFLSDAFDVLDLRAGLNSKKTSDPTKWAANEADIIKSMADGGLTATSADLDVLMGDDILNKFDAESKKRGLGSIHDAIAKVVYDSTTKSATAAAALKKAIAVNKATNIGKIALVSVIVLGLGAIAYYYLVHKKHSFKLA